MWVCVCAFKRETHQWAWIVGGIVSAVWLSVMFMGLLYIHDTHPQPDHNFRRLITIFSLNIVVCSHLAGIEKVMQHPLIEISLKKRSKDRPNPLSLEKFEQAGTFFNQHSKISPIPQT